MSKVTNYSKRLFGGISMSRDINELVLSLEKEELFLRQQLAEAENEGDKRRAGDLIFTIVGLCKAMEIVKEWID